MSPNLDFSGDVRRITGGPWRRPRPGDRGERHLRPDAQGAGARLVTVGNLETGTVALNPGLVIVKELEILGASATTQAELNEAVRLVETGSLRSWVSDVLPLHEAARAHDRLERKEVAGRLVLEPVH